MFLVRNSPSEATDKNGTRHICWSCCLNATSLSPISPLLLLTGIRKKKTEARSSRGAICVSGGIATWLRCTAIVRPTTGLVTNTYPVNCRYVRFTPMSGPASQRARGRTRVKRCRQPRSVDLVRQPAAVRNRGGYASGALSACFEDHVEWRFARPTETGEPCFGCNLAQPPFTRLGTEPECHLL
jgi:hypothetical protein